MRIGFTQPYSATEVVITGYHDSPDEIKNLEQYAYIVIPNGLVIPAGSMAIHNTTSGTYRFVPIPAVKADEDRITALESENVALKATLDDMILNSPIPAMQAAIDELILTGGGL